MYELTLKDFEYKINGNNLIFKRLLNNIDDINLPGKYNINDNIFKLSKISPYSFSSKKIKSIILPKELKELDEYAFCDSDVSNVIFQNGVYKIPEWCFANSSLKIVELPDTINKIDDNAFCNSDIESINIPRNVKEISGNCFAFCDNLKNVTLNKDCKIIKKQAFYQCKKLENINLNNITTFEFKSFSDCVNLNEPDLTSAKEISLNTFLNCKKTNISYQNYFNEKKLNYEELKKVGFDDKQIKQIFNGYKHNIYLHNSSTDIPDELFEKVIDNYKNNRNEFSNIVKSFGEKLNLEEKIKLYKKVDELISSEKSIENKEQNILL